MNEEIDDTGIFLQDFTAVSDWEILILRIEEVISLWKLSKVPKEVPLQSNDFKKYKWDVFKENIDIKGYYLSVFRYKLNVSGVTSKEQIIDTLDENDKYCQALVDLKSDENDFDSPNLQDDSIPMIALWYGLRDFVVLKCNGNKDIKGSDVKIFMSSINIAINNTGCQIPIFIQCLESWQDYFVGICDFKDLCIKFDNVHLQKIPSQCHYLVGLLDMFKGKIASPMPLDGVQISAQFIYDLTDSTSSMWMQEPPDFEFLQGKTLGISNYSTIPFGAISDPIKNLFLCTSWLKLSEDTIVDSQTHSDLDPLFAPLWSLNIEFAKKNTGLLYKFIETFIALQKNNLKIKTFLDDACNLSEQLSGSLRIPKSIQNNSKIEAEPFLAEPKYYSPITYDTMKSILHFIFLDDTLDPDVCNVDQSGPFVLNNETLKASQMYDLIWRLAVISAHISQMMEDPHALAHIWYEFAQELRCKWDNAIVINRIMDGFPNSRTCLLHQKIQMLNVCIYRRKAREATSLKQSTVAEESSDDEFFECDDENADDSLENKKYSLWNKPVGRLAKFGNQKLIESGDQMYIPVTQEPVPKTEDQLEEDAEVMLTLDVGPSRSETIARIMSASLLSDMESFKAANPGSIFEDFIRWYSPRDWVEEEEENEHGQKKGHLSARMLIPDNMWLDVWKSAKPVPAKRQRRLFDDTKEGEKILHFLESRSVAQIVNLLLPSLTQAVVEKLGQECIKSPELQHLETYFERLKNNAMKLTREKANAEKYKTLLEHVYNLETNMSQLNSLKLKFDYSDNKTQNIGHFLKELVTEGESKVPGNSRGEIGSRIKALFRNSAEERGQGSSFRNNLFPNPVQKDFVLRVNARRPSAYSAPSLQMMRAILRQNSCRLLGAFTEDTVFA